jgi:hypothetical protein
MPDEKKASNDATKEEDLALEELLEGEQASAEKPAEAASPVEAGSAEEEEKALEELLSGEAPAKESVTDHEAAALEELLESGSDSDGAPSSEEARAVTDDSKDEEAAALEELMATDNQGEDAPVEKGESDGVITLNEVVALGGISAEGDRAAEDEAVDALMEAQDEPDERPSGQVDDVDAVGLSREERDDLDRLIKGLKEEQPSAVSKAAFAELEKQVKVMRKRIVQLGKLVKQHDKKMKSYAEIMRLFFKKSELMNQRIDAIPRSKKGGKRG